MPRSASRRATLYWDRRTRAARIVEFPDEPAMGWLSGADGPWIGIARATGSAAANSSSSAWTRTGLSGAYRVVPSDVV